MEVSAPSAADGARVKATAIPSEAATIGSELVSPDSMRPLAVALLQTADGLSVAHTRLTAINRSLSGSLKGAFEHMPHLITVDLSGNRLTSLEGLEALPALASLTCRGNRLMGVLDFAAPAGLSGSQLRFADLSDNVIPGAISLPPDSDGRALGVDAHTQIEVLMLDRNRLRSLRGVGAARCLTKFSAAGNQLRDTAGLAPLSELQHLDLSANCLANAEELSELTALRVLHLADNQLSGLPSMSGLRLLTSLQLERNAFASLTSLTDSLGGKSLSAVRSLSIAGNPLLEGLADARLKVLYAIQSVATLDGTDATPEEVADSRSMHGDDTEQLASIRRGYFPDKINSTAHAELPGLLHLYRRQHTAAFAACEPE